MNQSVVSKKMIQTKLSCEMVYTMCATADADTVHIDSMCESKLFMGFVSILPLEYPLVGTVTMCGASYSFAAVKYKCYHMYAF